MIWATIIGQCWVHGLFEVLQVYPFSSVCANALTLSRQAETRFLHSSLDEHGVHVYIYNRHCQLP